MSTNKETKKTKKTKKAKRAPRPHHTSLTVYGKEYSSIRAVAREFDIHFVSLAKRIRLGDTPEAAVEHVLAHKTQHNGPEGIGLVVDGKHYKSRYAAWKALLPDLTYMAFCGRISRILKMMNRTNGTYSSADVSGACDPNLSIPLDVLLGKVVPSVAPGGSVPRKRPITIWGTTYTSINEAARAHNIKPSTFHYRLNRGLTPEQCVSEYPYRLNAGITISFPKPVGNPDDDYGRAARTLSVQTA